MVHRHVFVRVKQTSSCMMQYFERTASNSVQQSVVHYPVKGTIVMASSPGSGWEMVAFEASLKSREMVVLKTR